MEVLLITSHESGPWTIPKGWPITQLAPHQVAEREAWEEAGVRGKAKKRQRRARSLGCSGPSPGSPRN
ncbi:NUDIX domain-containing protein [Rhizobium binae]|uniref:NUDIX domain-containing protein n=1 Tax=Rhizobium binae TaxID=1138190 RepID=UPI0035C8AA9C